MRFRRFVFTVHVQKTAKLSDIWIDELKGNMLNLHGTGKEVLNFDEPDCQICNRKPAVLVTMLTCQHLSHCIRITDAFIEMP